MSRDKVTVLYGLFVAILVLILGIAYARVTTELKVEGTGDGSEQKGVYITNVEYLANNGADTENSEINYYLGTMLDSKVILGSSSSSTITYKVTIKNNTDREQVFIGIVKDDTNEVIYSNTNITQSVETAGGVTGIEAGVTTIAPGESIIFPVTYKYVSGASTSNQELQSKINFRFREVPIIDLSNEGETYTLENISAGHVEEYEFTVSNYNKDYNNGVPMTYTLETTLTEGSPLEAKIYDENGAEVTESITMAGDGTQADHTYTLKLTWDESKNGTEYQGQEDKCNIKLIAKPDDTDYADYSIEKLFNVDITTNITPTLTVAVSNITATGAKITATGTDGDGDSLQYTLEINGQTYTSDTGIFDVTGLGTGKTYSYTVSVTDGYEIVTETGELTTECKSTVVEYIESTGTQYIDTGIYPTSATTVRLGFNMTQVTGFVICGYYISETDDFRLFNYQGQAYLDYGSGDVGNRIFGGVLSAGIKYNIEFGNRYVKNLDTNENIVSSTSVTFSKKTKTIGIFGDGNLDPSIGKLYYCQIFDNGVLVRDFIPALDENGVVCLYDKVTKEYYYNSGTGTFNYVTKQVDHTFGDWVVTTAATCTTAGSQTRTCTVCGDTQTQTIEANGSHNYVKPAQAGTKFTITGNYSDGTNTAVIPAGFTVSGKGGVCTRCGAVEPGSENIISEGLVIYLIQDKTTSQLSSLAWNDATTLLTLKKTYDQFVWIPMPKAKINDMYMCQSETGSKTCKIGLNSSGQAYCSTHKSTAMAGRLYATTFEENYNPTLTTQTYKANEGLREPDTVSEHDGNTTFLGQLNGILGTSYSTASALKTDLQSEYNEIVKSVYENEGFYIGRYETSGMVDSNTNVTVRIVAGSDNSTNANISSVTWYRMYAQQKKYAANKGLTGSIGSTMIQGAAYDQVMKFIDPTTSFVKTTGRVGHRTSYFTSYPYQTGGLNYSSVYTGTVTYNDVAKNIYDLEGNVYASTTEAFDTFFRVPRGGQYNSDNPCYNSDTPSYRRDYDNLPIGASISYVGSLCQLYVHDEHTYVNGVCGCGATSNHTYGNWVVTKAATCAATGTQIRTCTVCGATETQTIAKLTTHTYGSWTTTTAATCTTAGSQKRTCTVCGTSQTQAIAATGIHKASTYLLVETYYNEWEVYAKCAGCSTVLINYEYATTFGDAPSCRNCGFTNTLGLWRIADPYGNIYQFFFCNRCEYTYVLSSSLTFLPAGIEGTVERYTEDEEEY